MYLRLQTHSKRFYKEVLELGSLDSSRFSSVRFWVNFIMTNEPKNHTGFETHLSQISSFLCVMKSGPNGDCNGISFGPHLDFTVRVKPK